MDTEWTHYAKRTIHDLQVRVDAAERRRYAAAKQRDEAVALLNNPLGRNKEDERQWLNRRDALLAEIAKEASDG